MINDENFFEVYLECLRKIEENLDNLLLRILKTSGLESFEFFQYIPYFNDGDPCEFKVHCEPEDLTLNGEYCWDWEDEDLLDSALKIEKFLGQLPARALGERYGWHSSVRVSREGISTSEYYHE